MTAPVTVERVQDLKAAAVAAAGDVAAPVVLSVQRSYHKEQSNIRRDAGRNSPWRKSDDR